VTSQIFDKSPRDDSGSTDVVSKIANDPEKIVTCKTYNKQDTVTYVVPYVPGLKCAQPGGPKMGDMHQVYEPTLAIQLNM
jgi:hypothetical protein